jgi:hypothetical protein
LINNPTFNFSAICQDCKQEGFDKEGDIGMNKPFEYQEILYNEVIYFLETKWKRRLSDHERQVLIEGYRFGRLVEAENEIKILSAK